MTNLNEKSIETHGNSALHLEDIHQDDAGIINGSNNLPVYKGVEGIIETGLAIIGLVFGYIASQQLGNQAGALAMEINADLGPKDYYYWITASALLAGVVGWVYAGPLSDQYGRRPIIIVGNCIALLGAIVGASAQHLYVVIIGLIIAGLGSGGQFQRQKAYNANYVGLLYLAPFPFLATGQIVAVAIGSHSTWRWIFYLNIILTTISLILITLFFNPMFITGVGLAAVWAGFGKYQWNTAAILVPLILGITSAILIWPHAHHFAQNALYPSIMFQNLKGFVFLILAGALSAFCLASMNLIYPQEITALFTTDAMKTARYQLTSGFGAEFGVIFAGMSMRFVGHTNLMLTVAAILVALFVGLMASVTPGSIKGALAYTALGQFSGGCVKTLIFVSVTYAVPDALIGTAIAILNLGWSFGPGFARLPPASLSALLGAIKTGNQDSFMKIPGISVPIISAATQATKHTYADAFQIVWFVGMAAGIMAIPFAFFTQDVGPAMNSHLAVARVTEHSMLRKVRGKVQKKQVQEAVA
ncbi:major facilitator superfamily domain-containing protein [Hyaloscypha finlandica]|nr:major facilitator superfamily domain-containing protein [Hyaloscypha finlandica]